MNTQTTIALPDLPGIEPGWELVTRKAPGPHGEFTGERLHEERRAAILGAIGEGLGVRQIARAFRVSTNTVLALRRNAGGDIETEKARAAGRFADLRDLAVERIIDEIDEMPRQTLAIVAGIATDKAELLRGAPTARVQHDHALSVASLSEYIDSLPSANPPVEARGSAALKEPAGSVIEVASEVAPTSEKDSQSTVSAQLSEAAAVLLADSGQNSATKGSSRAESAQLRPGAARERRASQGGGGIGGFPGGVASTDGSEPK